MIPASSPASSYSLTAAQRRSNETRIKTSFPAHMLNRLSQVNGVCAWFTYARVLNPTKPVNLQAINLVGKIGSIFIHTAPYGSQIYSDSTYGMQSVTGKDWYSMFETFLIFDIQRASAFVPHQSAQSPNLYSCMFFRESMEYDLAYFSTYDIVPIRLRSLIQVNEQILLHLQASQSNIKSRTLSRTLNYMIFALMQLS
jgi:hypothetical protein